MFVGKNVTDQLRKFSRDMSHRRIDFTPTPRDRSLAGKKRIRARKRENKTTAERD